MHVHSTSLDKTLFSRKYNCCNDSKAIKRYPIRYISCEIETRERRNAQDTLKSPSAFQSFTSFNRRAISSSTFANSDHSTNCPTFSQVEPVVIIDPPTVPHPLRDSFPQSTPPALEPVPTATNSSCTLRHDPSRPSISEPVIPAVRTRSELDEASSGSDLFSSARIGTEPPRASKRQRIDSRSSTSTSLTAIDRSLQQLFDQSQGSMMLQELDQDSTLSVSPELNSLAGPSSIGLDGNTGPPVSKNGLTNGNGHTVVAMANGSSGIGNGVGNGVVKREGKSVAKVTPPGSTLYDDSTVDREEFIRLVIQSLQDVGYTESAATLEAESGYSLEASEVSQFRQYILEGQWNKAEAALMHLGVVDEEGLLDARFLISQQKYLELLEAQKTTAALYVLRNEVAPLNVDAEHLHTLSSLIMCSEAEDLRRRAGWDGAAGSSRRQLLSNLHRYIPSSIMIPQRRFATLLHQALSYQRQRCVYHNSPPNSTNFSLYMDHQCDKEAFPRVTTTILQVHEDEVWNLEWSHDGLHLASASKDKTAIIWRVGPESSPNAREWSTHLVLRDHQYAVGCLAWSLDDSILLTSAEQIIKLWNTKTGVCIRTIDAHSDVVTALAWLPDDSGFISGSLDRKVIQWDREGIQRDSWGATAIRVTDLAVTPDFTRLVTIGMDYIPPHSVTVIDVNPSRLGGASAHVGDTNANTPPAGATNRARSDNRMIIYDLASKQSESSIRLEGELTSVKISQNSQYALINHSPDEIHLWDLHTGRLTRKFTGQRQGRHVIRSCFGGIEGNFVVSGSEDGNVYVWHRDTGTLLEVLSGHGEGSVNSVAWNPRNERMFASCSDDRTIRIWEAVPFHDEPHFDTSVQPVLGSGYSSTVPTGKGKGKLRPHRDEDSGETISRTSGTGRL